MSVTYTYDVATAIPAGNVNEVQLDKELRLSTLASSYEYCGRMRTAAEIAGSLPGSLVVGCSAAIIKATLDALIAAHVPVFPPRTTRVWVNGVQYRAASYSAGVITWQPVPPP